MSPIKLTSKMTLTVLPDGTINLGPSWAGRMIEVERRKNGTLKISKLVEDGPELMERRLKYALEQRDAALLRLDEIAKKDLSEALDLYRTSFS